MSQLAIITPAADRALVTIEDLRAAAGVGGEQHDALLTGFGYRIADSLARQCGLAAAPAIPPTFLEETVTETFRDVACRGALKLGRWPVTDVASIAVDGVAIGSSSTFVEDRRMLRRIAGAQWHGAVIAVVYTAGWPETPTDLADIVLKMVREKWFKDGPVARDPNLRRVRVDGVGERELWVPPKDDPLLSGEVLELLHPFMGMDL